MPTSDRARIRAFVPWWALLCLLAFIQSPGKTVADTKHDLVANPVGFLSNSLSMWSDTMTLGQLQNQSYGYLFPQGPFFAFFDLFPDWLIADWVTQALWWSLTLCLAFTGLYRLAEAIGVGTHTTRVIAALLYALSPRVITTLGAISSEAWPVALAPWIALPLVRVCLRQSSVARHEVVKAILLSGLAVLSTGAVNAVSTAAACIPAGLILLFSAFMGPRRARAWMMLAGWLAVCAIVSLWWIIPLLLLGGYAAPFTDYIESSGVTTRWLTLAEVLRGTTSWTPFVSVERIGGNALVSQPVLIYATMAVSAIGLVGLGMRRMPMRRMWLAMALIGIVIMAAWTEPFGPLWQQAREALDSSLAPLRNLHKFDTVLRLPLMLGVAHALSALPWPAVQLGLLLPARTRVSSRSTADAEAEVEAEADKRTPSWLHPERNVRVAASMLVLAIVVGATAPAWSARLAPTGGYKQVPAYWQEAADWINAHGANTRTLLLPSAPFADQDWGNTRDEPLQPLAQVPWAVRDAIPLVPPEAIRGLDGLRDALTRGREVPALDATLRNNGIGYLLVRHDLANDYRADSLTKIQRTLRSSASMEKVAEFKNEDGNTAIEIWGAGDTVAREHSGGARIIEQDQIPLVTGGPEVLARLNEVDQDAPVRILAGANAGTVTDTPARRGRNYGEVKTAESGILAEGEDTHVRNLVPDYTVVGVPLVQTITGRTQIEVSSSASEPYNIGGAASDHSVNALVDGDPTTWWEPLAGTGQAEYVSLRLEKPASSPTLTLTGAKVPALVQVKTGGDYPTSKTVQLDPGTPTKVTLSGEVSAIRITARIAPIGFALSELELFDGTENLTPVRLPVVPDSSPVVQRWVFGQEIKEGTLVRLFSVPGDRRVTVDADTCRSTVGDPWASLQRVGSEEKHTLNCGATIDLEQGVHRLDAKSRWVSLTSEDYFAPKAADQHAIPAALDGHLDASDKNRILWVPNSTNPGRELSLSGEKLQPITVNGWQQGWLVPAGASGTLSYAYAPATNWRNGILVGGAVAGLYALVTGMILLAFRRRHATDAMADSMAEPIRSEALGRDLPVWFIGALGLAAVALTANWPGVVVAAVLGVALFAGQKVFSEFSATTFVGRPLRAMLFTGQAGSMVLGAALLAEAPWPNQDYAGEHWPLQLLMVAALFFTVVLTATQSESYSPRRARANAGQAPQPARTMPPQR